MKNKASVILKQAMSLLSCIAKAKSITCIKGKASAITARLIMSSLVKDKKALLRPISNKIHSILGQHHQEHQQHDEEEEELDGDQSKAPSCSTLQKPNINDDQGEAGDDHYSDGDDDDKYPDLRHSLFDEEDDFDDPGGSIIDMVKNSKELQDGEDFRLEDEIDHAADLFITRFYKRMRLQKLESFKRYREMLARSM